MQGRRSALAPDLAVAPTLLALGLPLALGGVAWVGAMTDQHVRRPALGASIHRAAPADALAVLRPLAAVGVVVAVLLAGLGLRHVPRATGPAPSTTRRPGGRVATIVTAVLGVGLGLAAGAMALVLRWRWVHWAYVGVAAVLVPVGLALVVVGVAAGVVGRRRGAPVGVWEMAPFLAPQRQGYPVARWVAETTPGLEPWAPDEEGHRGE